MSDADPRRWLAWLVLAVAVGLAYANSLHGPFVYDDRLEVVGNETIHFIERWRMVLAYNWSRPLTIASYSLNWRIGGDDPFTYHLVDVALHVLNAGLAMLVVEAWARLRRLEQPLWIGAMAAGLWAVHPLGTEAVSYIAGRSEQLCATFYLAGLLAWSRYLRQGGSFHYAMAWLAAGLGAFTKEVAITLPVAMLLVDWLLHREGRLRGLKWWSYLPGLLGLGAFFGLRKALYGVVLTPHEPLRPLDVQLFTAAEVFWRYVRLSVLPVGLSLFHDHPETGPSLRSMTALLGIVASVAVALVYRRKHPLWAFCWLFFGLVLAPSSSLVPLKETMAEHRVHLSLLALAVPLIEALNRLGWRTRGAALALMLVLGLGTHRRNRVWQDEVALWEDVTAKNPDSAEAWRALGDAFYLQRKPVRARNAYRKAVKRDPELAMAWNKLGMTHADLGDEDAAIDAWNTALRHQPDLAEALNNLGQLAANHGDYRQAAEYFQTTLRHHRCNGPALRQLGRLYEEKLDQPRAAVGAYEAFLQCHPDDPVWSPRVRDRLTRLTW